MDYPAAYWIHLRTTHAIEATFAIVKARTHTTKGAGSRNAGLAMAFNLLTLAEKRWRKVNSAYLVSLVQAGVKFPVGQTRKLPELPSNSVVTYGCHPGTGDPQHLTISRGAIQKAEIVLYQLSFRWM